MKKLKTIIYFLLLLIAGCIEPFTPKTIVDAGNTLVIDGSINPAEQSAEVKVTRALPLDASQSEQAPREQFANVSIHEQGGASYQLNEVSPGIYKITGVNFDFNSKYRLEVRTIAGSTYESEFVQPLETPPLDSVSWRTIGDVFSVEANTHDFTNKAKYFLWTFEETYEYTAPLGSYYEWFPGPIILPRTESVYRCWMTLPSTSIIIGTTRQLNENIIRNIRVNGIPRGSEKILYRYSILVKQRAISEQEYEFWRELQNTTQNVGGLFDPMPTQVIGNLRCVTNPDEPVLGYFSAGNVVEERLFVRRNELPEDFRVPPRSIYCEQDSIPMSEIPFMPGPLYIVSTYGEGVPEGYVVSSRFCTDCTSVPGGVNQRPSFWED